ncbi:MORN repeat protein [Saprospira grandis DSM 2844]|uniref:MORN repeat protein n=1 Tax=Saprospira grandis DSM 2844 TaxID=694433 RepID=J1I1U3_9BACT|nr:hypothetical protein [Saprospira grandis]EJF52625.1 MORN repeat protein [Saprospira grandis DSM 2844]
MIKKIITAGSFLLLMACQGEEQAPKNEDPKIWKTEQQADLLMEYQFDTINQQKEGEYKEYSLQEGQKILLLERKMKAGLSVGEEKQYHQNGQLAGHFQYNEKGQLDGPLSYYYPNGQLKQAGHYKEGALDDSLKTYYPNGQIKEWVVMRNNEANGPFAEFYQNGQPKAKGTYLGNYEHCELWLYAQDSTGKLQSKMLCDSPLKTCATFWKAEEGELEGVNDLAKSTIDKMRPQCEPLD